MLEIYWNFVNPPGKNVRWTDVFVIAHVAVFAGE